MEVPAVTAEQMREVDRVAMQETGPNLFQMMENAGRNLAALSMELLGNGWQQASYLVLAGSGGNGGGGSVQPDISPITAAVSVYALLTLNIWEKSPPSSTRCSSPLRETRSELPTLTDSTPTSFWTHSSATV
jgi:hypothetical protein